jgi:ATP-dependent Clp protease, protease subunit
VKIIPIKGTVVSDDDAEVYDWWGYDYSAPKTVKKALKDANGADVVLEINSPGGYVTAGAEIYTALKSYSGNVTAQIVGQACSAASWVALAADKVEMSPMAQMMIHRTLVATEGNVDDLSSSLEQLNEMDKSLVDLYSAKTGKSPEDIYDLMSKTTWMNAKTAVENGFADEIMFDNQPVVTNAEGDLPIKPELIPKMKNLIHKNNTNKSQAKENLALLLWE